MEYIEGVSLYQLLHEKKEQEISWDLKKYLIKQAIQSINYLHNLPTPIAHRDIKSLNFMVTKNFKLKLIDFGCSQKEMMLVQ
jgi:serine/threonine protein kinase